MAGQRSEPGIHRIEAFGHAGEVPPLDELFHEAEFFVGKPWIGIPNRNGRRNKGLPGHIGSQFLQSEIRISGLVVGIGVHQR